MNGERVTGTVKVVHHEKGYAFLSLDDRPDLFLHASGMRDLDFAVLKVGMFVECTIQETTDAYERIKRRAIESVICEGTTTRPPTLAMV